MSEVIYKRNDLDIIMLMRKYGEEIKAEQKRIKEIEAQNKKNKRRMRR